jgi:hypothetical protein
MEIRRRVAYVLNDLSRATDKRWPSSMGFDGGLITPHRRKRTNIFQNVTQDIGLTSFVTT